MKKVLCIVIFTVFVATTGIAQMTAAPQPAGEPSLQELQWKAAYIQERIKNLQAEFATLQTSLKQVQEQIKAKQPPKPAEPAKPKKSDAK